MIGPLIKIFAVPMEKFKVLNYLVNARRKMTRFGGYPGFADDKHLTVGFCHQIL